MSAHDVQQSPVCAINDRAFIKHAHEGWFVSNLSDQNFCVGYTSVIGLLTQRQIHGLDAPENLAHDRHTCECGEALDGRTLLKYTSSKLCNFAREGSSVANNLLTAN